MSKKSQKAKEKNRQRGAQRPQPIKPSQQNVSKPSWSITKKVSAVIGVIGAIAGIIGTCIAYFVYVDSKITVTFTEHPPDILHTDFIFMNEGYFSTLYNTKATYYIQSMRYKDDSSTPYFAMNNLYINDYDTLYLGDIQSRQQSTARIPPHIFSVRNIVVERADIYFYMYYNVFFLFKGFERKQCFRFFADATFQRDHFIRKSCP